MQCSWVIQEKTILHVDRQFCYTPTHKNKTVNYDLWSKCTLQEPPLSSWLNKCMLHKAVCPSSDRSEWIMHSAISWTWATSAHCAVRGTHRLASLWGKSGSLLLVFPCPTSCLSLSPYLQLPHFTKLPNEVTCHLYTSYLSCFPLLFPPPTHHSLSLASACTVTVLPISLDAAGLTRRGEDQKAQRPACIVGKIGTGGGNKK